MASIIRQLREKRIKTRTVVSPETKKGLSCWASWLDALFLFAALGSVRPNIRLHRSSQLFRPNTEVLKIAQFRCFCPKPALETFSCQSNGTIWCFKLPLKFISMLKTKQLSAFSSCSYKKFKIFVVKASRYSVRYSWIFDIRFGIRLRLGASVVH